MNDDSAQTHGEIEGTRALTREEFISEMARNFRIWVTDWTEEESVEYAESVLNGWLEGEGEYENILLSEVSEDLGPGETEDSFRKLVPLEFGADPDDYDWTKAGAYDLAHEDTQYWEE